MEELRFSLHELECLYRMAAHIQKSLTAALEGKPAELLRHMVLDLDEIEGICPSDAVDSFDSMVDQLGSWTWKGARMDDGHGTTVVLSRDSANTTTK